MSKRFTDADIKNLREKGLKIIDTRPVKKNKITIPRSESKEVQWMHFSLTYWCKGKDIELKKEYRFAKDRRWRFDFAIPSLMIGIEYDGLNSEKSGHTTLLGFTDDTEKLNAASAQGWKVYRYTVINYKNVLKDLEKHINK